MANEKRLIDANALLELLKKFEPTIQGKLDLQGMIEHAQWATICGAIVDAPTVDAVEVVHGRWDGEYLDPRFICSECGKWFLVEDATGNMNYCPNCGAKMDGDGND